MLLDSLPTSEESSSDTARQPSLLGRSGAIFEPERRSGNTTAGTLILQCSGKSARSTISKLPYAQILANWLAGKSLKMLPPEVRSDFKAKMHQIRFPLGSAPDPVRKLTALPRPPSWTLGDLLLRKGRERRGRAGGVGRGWNQWSNYEGARGGLPP